MSGPRVRSPRVLAAAVFAVLSVLLGACGGESAGPDTGADVEDIAEDDNYFADSDRFVGQTVTVSARVTDVINPTSFELNAGEWGDETLLVISAEQENNVRTGEVVQVTGTVRARFTYPDVANQYELAPDPVAYDDYESEKYLVAKSVQARTRSTN